MSKHHDHTAAGTAAFSLETIPHLESGALLRLLMLGAGELLRRAFKTVCARLARAQQRRALLMLDDHLLRDIGITREQARIESGKPFWRC